MKYVYFTSFTYTTKRTEMALSKTGAGRCEMICDSEISSIKDIDQIEINIALTECYETVIVTNYILLRMER